MARTQIYIQHGLIFKKQEQKDLIGLFNLNKLIKSELEHQNVPKFDVCCDEVGVQRQPVGVNGETSELETYNGTAWVSFGFAAGSMFAGFFPTAAQNDIVAGTGGAISVTNYLTTINTDAGGDAFTLADGTQVGQLKKILLVVDGGGDAVITPANLAAGTTITMNDANDYVILIWNGTDWAALENSGSTIA